MDHPTLTPVYVYLRVSGDSQVEGDGFPRQIQACRDYAKKHNLDVVALYQEEGVSGTKETMDRPAWSAMMAALHADGVRTILIEKLDRLSRELFVQELAIRELRKFGFGLISTHEENLMSDDPTRVMFRQIVGAVGQYDRSMIVSKLRGARDRMRATTGRCEGRKPYGTRPGEMKVLRQIQAWHAEGVNVSQIALRLNRDNTPTRLGRPWNRHSVRTILERVNAPRKVR